MCEGGAASCSRVMSDAWHLDGFCCSCVMAHKNNGFETLLHTSCTSCNITGYKITHFINTHGAVTLHSRCENAHTCGKFACICCLSCVMSTYGYVRIIKRPGKCDSNDISVALVAAMEKKRGLLHWCNTAVASKSNQGVPLLATKLNRTVDVKQRIRNYRTRNVWHFY